MITYLEAEIWLLVRCQYRTEVAMPEWVMTGPELYERLCEEQGTDRPVIYEKEVTA